MVYENNQKLLGNLSISKLLNAENIGSYFETTERLRKLTAMH